MNDFQWIKETLLVEEREPLNEYQELEEAMLFLGINSLEETRIGVRRLLLHYRKFKEAYKDKYGYEYDVYNERNITLIT